jgi:predicted site-specific integrase-resolvase
MNFNTGETQMSTHNFISVAEAATFTGVSIKTIYYHINKSRKIFPIYINGKLRILENDLHKLYPAKDSGKKQFLKGRPETKDSMITQITDLINQNATMGNFEVCDKLNQALRLL